MNNNQSSIDIIINYRHSIQIKKYFVTKHSTIDENEIKGIKIMFLFNIIRV